MKKNLSVGNKDDCNTAGFGRKAKDFRRKDSNTDEKAAAERLRAAAETLVPEKEKRGDALRQIRKNIHEKTMCQTDRTIPLGNLFLIQLRHISPSFWIIQGILAGSLALLLKNISPGFWILQGSLVALLAALLEKTALDGGALPDYLRWISVLAAWMGVLGCCSLGRHFSQGMAELEQSCYFNLPQLWTIKMTLSGAADVLVLALGSGTIAGKTNLPFGQVCLYVMVPFVLSNICCLLFFTALRGSRNRYGQLVLALMTGLLAAAVSSLPMEAYAKGSLWAWAAVFSGGIGIYLCQLRYMYGKIRRGEIVCWN